MGLVTRLGTAAALLVVLVAAAAGCGAGEDATPLFREAARPPGVPPLPESPRLVRSRYVTVDFDTLGGASGRAASAPATLLLNLFPDATFIAERERMQAPGAGRGLTWVGHLQGIPDSSAMLVAEDGILAGTVSGGGHAYNIAYAGDGVHVIHEVNPRAFPPD